MTDTSLPNLWVVKTPKPSPGKIRDSEGKALSGFKVQETKKTRKVSIVNNGHYLRHYRFPKDIEAPKHPMIRWLNTPMSGISLKDEDGKFLTNHEAIIRAVFEGKKPVGDISFFNEKLEDKQALIKKANTAGFETLEYTKEHNKIRLSFVMFGVNKPLKELFELEAIARFYSEGTGWDEFEDSLLKYFSKIEHLTPVQTLQSYDCSSPTSAIELILNGLCLGYSLESTLALILE